MADKISPRSVFSCVATETYDKTETPRFGAWGKQSCEDTGALPQKRIETIDEEVLDYTKDFINRAHKADKPFFAWVNTTRMHVFTHLKKT